MPWPLRYMPMALDASQSSSSMGSPSRSSRSEEHTSELQSRQYLVCRLLLEKKQNPDVRCRLAAGDFVDGLPPAGHSFLLQQDLVVVDVESAQRGLPNCHPALTARCRPLYAS